MHNCFSLPRLLYFVRTSTCFAEKDLPKQYDDVLKKALGKVTNECFTDTLFILSVLPPSKIVFGVSSVHLIAFPAFVASAVSVRKALEQKFGEEFGDKELWTKKCSIGVWKSGMQQQQPAKHQKTNIIENGLRLCIKMFLPICCQN